MTEDELREQVDGIMSDRAIVFESLEDSHHTTDSIITLIHTREAAAREEMAEAVKIRLPFTSEIFDENSDPITLYQHNEIDAVLARLNAPQGEGKEEA